MIQVLPESKENILILRAVGKLTDQDYKDVLIPRLDSIIREHGKARLLLDMGDDISLQEEQDKLIQESQELMNIFGSILQRSQ